MESVTIFKAMNQPINGHKFVNRIRKYHRYYKLILKYFKKHENEYWKAP